MSTKLKQYQIREIIHKAVDHAYGKQIKDAIKAIHKAMDLNLAEYAKTNPLKFTKAQLDSGLVRTAAAVRINLPHNVVFQNLYGMFSHYSEKAGFNFQYEFKGNKVYYIHYYIPTGIRIPSREIKPYPPTVPGVEPLIQNLRDAQALEANLNAYLRPGMTIPGTLKKYPFLAKFIPNATPAPSDTNLARIKKILAE